MRIPKDPTTQRPILTTLLFVGSVLVVLRIVFVLLWSVVGNNRISDNLIVEISLGLISGMIIAAIVGVTVVFYGRSVRSDSPADAISTAVTTYAVSTLALLLFAGIVPFGIEYNQVSSWFGAISSNLIAVGVFTISIALAGFLTTQLLIRRHKRTRLYLIFQVIILFGIWVCAILDDLSRFFYVLGLILLVLGGIVTLLNIRRLNWLSTIALDKKIRLLWLTASGAFASAVLAVYLTFIDEAYMTVATRMFMSSGTALPSAINLFGFIYFIRLFFATVTSLPNSGIVDRRSSEVEALSSLTKLVTEATSVRDLLTEITSQAMDVCNAHGAWCELYEDGGDMEIVGEQLVSEEYVHTLHKEREIHRILTASSDPILIESMSDRFDNVASLSAIRSMVTIPIINQERRVGTLVMICTIEYGFENDDVKLLTAFGDTAGVAYDQAKLMETALEKERLQKEFDVARNIQASLLPRKPPEEDCCDVDAVTIPATQVGGDYFDYIRFSSGNLGAVIADVAGKGIPAALYMATLKGVVLAEMRHAEGPADLLNRINESLHGSMERHTYITMMCVEFDKDNSTLTIARAGHTPAILRRSGRIEVVTPRGVAIGIIEPDRFNDLMEEIKMDVSAGDICLLTTDGVNERRNRDLVEMEIEPLKKMVAEATDMSARDLVQSTLKLLDVHGEGTDQHDDITIVAVTFIEATATNADLERKNTTDGEST